MSGESPETNPIQTREAIIFRTVIGAVLVVAVTFGLLNLSGLIHVG